MTARKPMTPPTIPAGYKLGRFEDNEGFTLDERVQDLRRKYWQPLRRMLLERGVTAYEYVAERSHFRRLLVRYSERWCFTRILLEKESDSTCSEC